jgi:hypothetical protein
MSGRDTDDENWTYVDEIDQELSTGGLLLDLNGRQVLIGNFEVPGDYASAKVTPTRQSRFFYIEIAVLLIVMPRSFSSCLVSMYRALPALAWAMIPALETRESVRVDLPWSTAKH